MRKTVAALAVSLVMVFILAAGTVPVSATITGSVDFYKVVGGTCSSSNPVWPVWGQGGVGPVPAVTSNGPAGFNDPVINEGASICVVVDLSGQFGTVTASSPSFTGSFTVISGVGSGILTDNAAGVTSSCGTHPIKLSEGGGPGGQIYHVLLATDSGATGCTTTTITTGVPEFPIAGSLGLLMVVAIAVPLLVAARKWRSPIQIA